MLDYDFIEIGTSDFDTYIQTCDLSVRGLSIDPLQIYLNNLPEKTNIKKICAAITGFTTTQPTATVFYVNPEDIQKYNLPQWLRGCNSVFEKHPTTERILREQKLEHLLQTELIPLISIQTLFQTYSIKTIKILKLDTEGHDCEILEGLVAYCAQNTTCWPTEIIFEANCLTKQEAITQILEKLLQKYTILSRDDNIHLKIKDGCFDA